MSFTSYQNSVQLVNSIHQVQQTNELLDALTDLSILLSNAESQQWSFILLADPNELDQYHDSVQQLYAVLHTLRQPLADTEVQQQRLKTLEQLIDEQLSLFEAAIARYSEQPDAITPTDPLITRTQTNLSQIRRIITQLEEEEEEIITAQLEAVSLNSRIRMLIEPAGTLLTFSILLSMFGVLYQQLVKRQQAEAIQQALAQDKQLSELKLQLFSMVSHEFRTPLSLILGSSQLLEESLKESVEPRRLKNLYRIQSSAKVMSRLLNDILMLARADAGKLEFQPKWVEIQTFCLNLTEDFQVSNPPARSLSFVQQGDRTHAYIDEKLLYSILSNLISNAFKFSPPDSTIYFTLLSEADAIRFQIRDEGIGIPSADLERLYEPFSRASNVRDIRGTGLGLAVVKKCLALHDGTITVQSDIGLGTTFTVMIPQNPDRQK